MNEEQIKEKLQAIVKPYVPEEVNFTGITGEMDLLNDLKINSANLVDIVLDAEDAFDIEISDDDADEMLTVDDAIRVIHKLVHA